MKVTEVSTRYENGFIVEKTTNGEFKFYDGQNWILGKPKLEEAIQNLKERCEKLSSLLSLTKETPKPVKKSKRPGNKGTKVSQYQGTKRLASFNSMMEAGAAVGVSQGAISHAISRKGKAGGYNWRKSR